MAEAVPPAFDRAKLMPLMLVLSATTGLVDAVSVLGLGKVFTANMTGNVIFLGMATAGAREFVPPLYIWAILTFMAGAIVGGRVGTGAKAMPLRRWLLTAALVETGLLWIAALAAVLMPVTMPSSTGLYTIIALTALAMGFRNATVRQLKIPDVTTTVLTLTLTGLGADSSLAGGENTNWGRRIASVASLFVGAAAGAVMVLRSGLTLPLAVAGGLILMSTLLCCARLRS